MKPSPTAAAESSASPGRALANSPWWPVALFPVALLATCGGLLLHLTAWPLYFPAGDLAQTFWNYWWFDFATVGQGRHPLRCDWLFHPIGGGLTFHTMGLFYCVVFWPLRALLGVAAAYNLQIATTYALTMLFTYGLARQLGASRFAAAIAGLGAGMGRYRFTFAFQMNVLSTQWIPLYFWMLVRVLGPDARRRDAFWLGAAVACMIASVWHYLLFCATLTPLFILVAWARDRRLFAAARLWRHVCIAALVAAPVFAFYAWSAVDEAREFPTILQPGDRQRLENSAAVADYLLSPRLAAMASGDEHRPPLLGADWRYADRLFFLPGYLLGLLALAGAWFRGRRPTVDFGPRYWLLLALCAAVLSFGPELVLLKTSTSGRISPGVALPYAFLQRLPVYGDISQLYRWGYLATLALAVAGALAVEPVLAWLRRRLPGIPQALLRVTLAAIVFFECYAGSYPWNIAKPATYTQFLKQTPDDVAILELPDAYINLVGRYMLNQTIHEKRLMGGYTSRQNARFNAFCEEYAPIRLLRAAVFGDRPNLDDEQRRAMLEAAAMRDLRYVVLHLEYDSSRYQMRATRQWLIDQRVAAPVFEDEQVSVLRFVAP